MFNYKITTINLSQSGHVRSQIDILLHSVKEAAREVWLEVVVGVSLNPGV